jgi:iron complex outermembrane receptor protein
VFGGAKVATLAEHNAQSYAAFADVDWQITDQLRLSVGGRYTSDRKKLALQFGPQGGAPFFRTNESESWQEFTPKVSADFKFTDDVLAYASFSRGYRSGGFNARAQDPIAASVPYNPETVESIEAGLKTTTFDGRLTFNVAAFTTKYEDKQEEVVEPTATAGQQQTIVANAASATIRGLEFESSLVPFENLTLQASLGFLDAEYDEFATLELGQVIDLSGLSLRRAPEMTGSISGEYEIPTSAGDFNLALSYRYIDEYQSTITPQKFRDFSTGAPVLRTVTPARNDPRGLTDSQHNVDASVSYERETPNGTFVVSVFGRNLLDDTGLSGTLPVAGLFTFGTPRAPRTYGIEFGYEF